MMSRKKKNIIMCGLLVILIFLSYLNVDYVIDKAYSSSSVLMQNSGNNLQKTDGPPPEGAPPEGSSGEKPPEKPEGEPPEGSNGEKPPEKPEGEEGERPEVSAEGTTDGINGETFSGDGETSNDSVETTEDKTSEESNNVTDSEVDFKAMFSKISVYNYVVFVFNGLSISILLSFLIMSQFNGKTIKETFNSLFKKIIFVVCIIILSTGITLIETSITVYNLPVDSKLKNNISTSVNVAFSGASEIENDVSVTSGDYNSEKKNENSLLIAGNISAIFENVKVDKTGDSFHDDNLNFYGINSAILAKDSAEVILKKININTNAFGANAIFSYGGSSFINNTSSDGTTISIYDSNILTEDEQSAGIMTAGGGNLNAHNLTVVTNGISSAPIRTDRGGGLVKVEGGEYTSNGSGSPAIYSTGEIHVNNAKLISNVSEGVVIEGLNSVTLENCTLIDSNSKLHGQATSYKNIILFQSMGSTETGGSIFNATNSNITTNIGDTFYVTNTTGTINLENTLLINNDNSGNLLRVKADSWGTAGTNGGYAKFNLTNQKAVGNIIVDNISELEMKLKSNSYYEGKINSDNTAKLVNLTLDKSSNIKLTGDSYISSFSNKDKSNSNINFNGYKLFVDGKAIN